MCSPEELPKIEESHEYQTEKERREQKMKMSNLKVKQDNEIGNRDYIGKKRYDTDSKDITPLKSGGKTKYS